MEQLLAYLNENITEKMTIEEIVSVFEKMCQIPVEHDMILFETGTFNFTGEDLFYFTLARQFPNDEEEYFQIRVDILYQSMRENEVFQEAIWNEDIDDNIFDYIRNSQAFAYARNKEYVGVEIYMDET